MEPAPASPTLKPASKWLRLLAHGMDLALSLALVRAIGVLVGYQPEAGSLSNAAIFLIPPAVIAALAGPLTTVICDDEDQMAAAELLQLLTGAALVVAPRRGFLSRLTITTTGNKP